MDDKMTGAFKAWKEAVLQANLDLFRQNLIRYTWGNVSEIDRGRGLIAIKPSGVVYESMKADDIVIMDMDGNRVDGNLNPSCDFPTHLYLYKNMPEIGGVTHTHSTFATAFAQARRPIPALGTTHADYFHGAVPVTAPLSAEQTDTAYEENTGVQIVETMKKFDVTATPGVLVAGHGVFTFGKDGRQSVFHAGVLEEVAKIAYLTRTLDPQSPELEDYVSEKHYERKHGKNRYYGQN